MEGNAIEGKLLRGERGRNDIEDGVRGSRRKAEEERDLTEGFECEYVKTIK